MDPFEVVQFVIPVCDCRHLRRPYATVLGIISAAWVFGVFGSETAIAGCGDYLMPPLAIAQHQTLPPELIASGFQRQHSERPCRGPNCHQTPRQESPQPLPVTIVVTDHWACSPSGVGLGLPEISLWVAVPPLLAGRDFAHRLDRPPRV